MASLDIDLSMDLNLVAEASAASPAFSGVSDSEASSSTAVPLAMDLNSLLVANNGLLPEQGISPALLAAPSPSSIASFALAATTIPAIPTMDIDLAHAPLPELPKLKSKEAKRGPKGKRQKLNEEEKKKKMEER